MSLAPPISTICPVTVWPARLTSTRTSIGDMPLSILRKNFLSINSSCSPSFSKFGTPFIISSASMSLSPSASLAVAATAKDLPDSSGFELDTSLSLFIFLLLRSIIPKAIFMRRLSISSIPTNGTNTPVHTPSIFVSLYRRFSIHGVIFERHTTEKIRISNEVTTPPMTPLTIGSAILN